ncbi:MAG TPA: bL35 family ribosomal protein [Phycisphaerae bacterium]|nr:bL35 family ribosomal protein [Phycisphaerae bacterium]HPS52422.1 bL35 family ribosomal protein [Phycisphaerae bacterium]
MPKQKTNKAVAKRIKVTGTGKMKHYSPGSGHLKSRKSNKILRNFRKAKDLSPTFARMAKKMLHI